MADFFEKIKKGIDKSVTTVSVKSKEMLETTQLRSLIKTLQDEKRARLEELGNIVYTLFVQEKLDQEQQRIREKCEGVVGLDKRIREKEEEIIQVQQKAQEALGKSAAVAMASCSCGATLYEGTKFCGSCGKPVQVSGSAVDPKGGTDNK